MVYDLNSVGHLVLKNRSLSEAAAQKANRTNRMLEAMVSAILSKRARIPMGLSTYMVDT